MFCVNECYKLGLGNDGNNSPVYQLLCNEKVKLLPICLIYSLDKVEDGSVTNNIKQRLISFVFDFALH